MPYTADAAGNFRGGEYLFRALMGAGQQIGGSIDETRKKRDRLQEQEAFNQFGFQTLTQAKGPDGSPLLSEEEQQEFLSGNMNARNGIVAAGMARMGKSWQEKMATQQQQNAVADRELRLKIAEMKSPNSPFAQTKIYDDSGTDIGIYDERGSPHYYPKAVGLPAAGTTATGPDGKPIGVYDANGRIVQPKPAKTNDLADAMKLAGLDGSGQPAKPKAPKATTGDKIQNFLKTGSFGPATPVRIQNDEEFNLLPSGTEYIGPDGRKRRKP